MTCIVAVEHNGEVFIGADSLASNVSTCKIIPTPKVFRVAKYIVIGATVSYRHIDLLKYSMTLESKPLAKNLDRWMRTDFVNTVRKTFSENGALKKSEEVEEGGHFLVGIRGSIYEVQDDMSILNAPEWGMAVGSGTHAARGSLWTTRQWIDPLARIHAALEAAEACVPSVRGPFHVEQV